MKNEKNYKGEEFIKLNIEENSFNQLYNNLLDFQNKFHIQNETHKKYYVIFSYLFEHFKSLKLKELYNRKLNLNLSLISHIKLDKITLINDDYNINLVNEQSIILFNQFYNDD